MPELPIDDAGSPEVYVDGFDGYQINQNVLTCYGYRDIGGRRIVAVRLVMPVSGVPDTIGKATAAMGKMPMLALVERGTKRAH